MQVCCRGPGGGGRRYQSIAGAVGECSECHVVNIGIQLNTGLFVHCCGCHI